MTYIKNRIKAFSYAFSGIAQSFGAEAHLKLHAVIALMVIAAGFFFNVTKIEWFMLVLCISLVIAFEMLNSALEKLCDLVMPDQHPKIKYIKDVAAGAVLIVCLFALIVGGIVFIPYIVD
jgi:diacylglycerol kinase (ATP)